MLFINDVYFSTENKPADINLQCTILRDSQLTTLISAIRISNFGPIRDAKECKIILQDFEFEIESDFISNYRMSIPKVTILNTTLHLKKFDSKITELFNDSLVMSKFTQSHEIEIDELIQHQSEILYKKNSKKEHFISTSILLGGIVVTCLSLLILIFYVENRLKLNFVRAALDTVTISKR